MSNNYLFTATPIASPDDLRCFITLRIARGWEYARWQPPKGMPCTIHSIDVIEDCVEGTSTTFLVEFADLKTRDEFISQRSKIV